MGSCRWDYGCVLCHDEDAARPAGGLLPGDASKRLGKMVRYSKLWRELFEVVQGLGIITLGLVTLLILVVATAFVLHFVS